MPPILLNIYGPIAIHSFGVMIALGVIIMLCLLHRDAKLAKLVSHDQLTTIFQIGFVAGIIGGRVWFLMTSWSTIDHWTDSFMVWSGGLSILGAIIGCISALTIYFATNNINQLKVLDRIALYAPLLQSISRLGCFFAGCCFGQVTNLPWAIIYTNPDSLAPLCTQLHPTQIYSCLFLAFCFIVLLCFDKFYPRQKPGQILYLYIMLISLERFFIDFLRGDREFFEHLTIFENVSIQQALALCMFAGAFVMMIFISIYKKTDESI